MYFRKKIENLFGNFAYFIACHAWKVCLLSVLCNALFGLCLINLFRNDLVCNKQDIYLPSNTQTQEGMDMLLKVFPVQNEDDFYAHRNIHPQIFASLIIWRKDRGNVIISSLYEEINSVLKHVKVISVNATSEKDNRVTFQDVCMRRNGTCVIDGEVILGKIKTREPIHLKRTLDPALDSLTENVANITIENATLKSATYLRFTFYLRREINTKMWTASFITEMQTYIKNLKPDNLQVAYSHSDSFFEELSKDSSNDIRYFSLVFTVYFIYVGFVLSGGNSLTNRSNIARIGTLVTPVSIIGAWGVLAASHVMYTNIVGITPFFIVCHQIINVMVTLSHLSETYNITDGKDRVRYAVQRTVIPVTASLICHTLPFAVGLMSSFFVIKLVSIYIVTTLLFNYINHFVFYTACLAIHESRIDAGRHYCVCVKLKSRDQLKGRNCCFLCCCYGSKPSRRSDAESKLQAISRQCLFQMGRVASVKFISVVSCIAVITVALFGLINYFHCDVIQADEVLPGSYFYDWNRVVEENFNRKSTVQIAFAHPLGYTDDMAIISDLVTTLKSEASFMTNSAIFWHDFVNKSDSEMFQSEEELVEYVKSHLLPKYHFFADDIVLDNTEHKIIASRLYIKVENVTSTISMANVKQYLDEVCMQFNHALKAKYLQSGLKSVFPNGDFVIVYSPDFISTDGYMRPLWEMLTFHAAQCSFLLIFSLIFSGSIRHTIFTPVLYIAMVTSIVGLSSYCDIYLCLTSMLFYMLGGCYCAEVVVNSFVSAVKATDEPKQARFIRILGAATQSLLHAMTGQFIAIFLLLFANSFFFVTAFRLTVTTTGVCIIASVLWSPTIICFSRTSRSPESEIPTEANCAYENAVDKSTRSESESKDVAANSAEIETDNTIFVTESEDAEVSKTTDSDKPVTAETCTCKLTTFADSGKCSVATKSADTVICVLKSNEDESGVKSLITISTEEETGNATFATSGEIDTAKYTIATQSLAAETVNINLEAKPTKVEFDNAVTKGNRSK